MSPSSQHWRSLERAIQAGADLYEQEHRARLRFQATPTAMRGGRRVFARKAGLDFIGSIVEGGAIKPLHVEAKETKTQALPLSPSGLKPAQQREVLRLVEFGEQVLLVVRFTTLQETYALPGAGELTELLRHPWRGSIPLVLFRAHGLLVPDDGAVVRFLDGTEHRGSVNALGLWQAEKCEAAARARIVRPLVLPAAPAGPRRVSAEAIRQRVAVAAAEGIVSARRRGGC